MIVVRGVGLICTFGVFIFMHHYELTTNNSLAYGTHPKPRLQVIAASVCVIEVIPKVVAQYHVVVEAAFHGTDN